MPRFKDQAICIRLIDWSETSQIATLLTEQHGKLPVLAKGSKRTSPGAVARYSGGLELLTLGQAVGISKPTSELATLTEWDLQEPFWHLRHDLAGQHLALYAADITRALLADHDPHPNTFIALARFLSDLADPLRHQSALLRFHWLLLDDCGYRPQFNRDVLTNQPLPTHHTGPYLFDAHAGGLTASASIGPSPPYPTTPTGPHRVPPPSSRTARWPVRPDTVGLIRRLTAAPGITDPEPDTPGTNTPGTATLQRANRLLCAYSRAILDRHLPTMSFILNNDPPPETPVSPLIRTRRTGRISRPITTPVTTT